MRVPNILREIGRSARRRAAFCRRVAGDPRTPRAARLLIVLALLYLASPIDLIPDFIPVLGYLDDVLVVPALLAMALWMVPREVLDEARGIAPSDASSDDGAV